MAKTEVRAAQIKDADIDTADLKDKAVTLAKLLDLAQKIIIGRKTLSTGVPELCSISDVLDMLDYAATGSPHGVKIPYRYGSNTWKASDAGTDGRVLGATSSSQLDWVINGGPVVILRDEKTQNTAGGTATSGSWVKRDLNVEDDTEALCTLSSSVFTLAAGTWKVQASCPAFFVDGHQARLQNTSDATTTIWGTTEFSRASGTDYDQTRSYILGKFNIGTSKNFEIQHKVATTNASVGFGVAANLGTEVYTIAMFERIGN